MWGKTRKKVSICFVKVKYLPSKSVFKHLMEKANNRLLIPQLSNALIWIIKTINIIII